MKLGQLPTSIDLSTLELFPQSSKPHKRSEHRMPSHVLDQAFIATST